MAKKKKSDSDLFCLYFINFNKVFEIAMLLDNKVTTGEEVEINSNHSIKLAAKLKNMLAMVFEGTADIGYDYSKGSQLRKTVEIKMTNSVVLKELIQEVKLSDKNINEAQEGQLILIDDVNLKLVNEEETRQMKLVKQGVLDRFIMKTFH